MTVKSVYKEDKNLAWMQIHRNVRCVILSYIDGLQRKHRFHNRVLGFEIDLQKHIVVPKTMGENVITKQAVRGNYKCTEIMIMTTSG